MSDGRTILLTTDDNPYSPFDQYDEWFLWDTTNGYNTCSYLERVVGSPNDFNNDDYLDAIQRITTLNYSGKHIAVVKEDFKPPYLK